MSGLARIACLALALCAFGAAGHAGSDVATSYGKAVVYVPGGGGPIVPAAIPATNRHPVVLFMHGCGGIGNRDQDAHKWAELIAAAGYIAVLPDSLARSDRPRSCDTVARKAGLFPGVYEMRRGEIVHAADEIRRAPWFDGRTLLLMGYSEGAILVTTAKLEGFNGVVATSWTCNIAGVPHLDGINVPKATPLLTLVHESDPWFQNPIFKGSCADRFEGRPDARHITVPGQGHGTYKSEAARLAVTEFLARLRNRS